MKRKPTPSQLILKGNPRGSAACWKSDKSTNCHVATELRGGTIDTRMKPDWLTIAQWQMKKRWRKTIIYAIL